MPQAYYDNPGAYGYSPPDSMTLDPNQRVHLFHPASVGLPANPQGGTWASWQELRTTDGPWNPTNNNLSKSTLHVSQEYTLGPGGFSFGMVRWFAIDILFTFNIDPGTGVLTSFQAWNSGFGNTLGILHDSGGTGSAPAELRLLGSNPRSLYFSQTSDQSAGSSIPYEDTLLLQLWDSSGNRVASAFNTWHEIVVGERFSADSTGWYEVWVDGVKKVQRLGRAIVTPGEGGPYLVAQNYTEWPITFVGGANRSAVVFGGVRAGLTRADVQTR